MSQQSEDQPGQLLPASRRPATSGRRQQGPAKDSLLQVCTLVYTFAKIHSQSNTRYEYMLMSMHSVNMDHWVCLVTQFITAFKMFVFIYNLY